MHQGPGPAVENRAAMENTPAQRQRIQMVLLRESGMTQSLIAAAMGVSLSTVNRAHMAYDLSGIKALKPKPSGGRRPTRQSSTRRKISGTKSAKKSSKTMPSNQSTPCAPSSSKRSSTSTQSRNRKIHHLIPLHSQVSLIWKWYNISRVLGKRFHGGTVSSLRAGLQRNQIVASNIIIWIIVIGFIAGIISRFLSPGPNELGGFVLTTALGIAGAFVATFFGQTIGWYGLDQGAGLIGATVGALLLLFVWNRQTRCGFRIPARSSPTNKYV
jgi:uncharacterized membrane protein YeaQ/YmgE (transglycosylase-associated protein family)